MSSLNIRNLQGLSAYSNVVQVPSGNTFQVTENLRIPVGTTAQRPAGSQEGSLRYNSNTYAIEIYINGQWSSVASVGLDGTASTRAATSATAILALNSSAPNGVYYIDTGATGGVQEVYCDMTGGGWMYLMRGYGTDDLAYGDARWTDATSAGSTNLHSGAYGTYAKSSAFYYKTGLKEIRLDAQGFTGQGATTDEKKHYFGFGSTNTAANLMFSTTNAITSGPSWDYWRSSFGHDRNVAPQFLRYGSGANSFYANAGRSILGCGQPMMFGFNAHDNPNDVNSGLGTNASYCGGAPGGFARGSWMGNNGYVRIWAR